MAKRLTLIAAMILLGAAINVAVAWGWAACGVPYHLKSRTWSISHDDLPLWLMHEFAGPGAAVTHVRPVLEKEGRSVGVLRRLAQIGPEVRDDIRQQFSHRPDPADTYRRFAFDERGWPWRCLASEHSYRWVNRPNQFIDDVEVCGGIQVWPEQTLRGGWALQRVRALPLRPIWPAFMANTILYTIIAAIILVGYPAMIRSLGACRCARRALVALAIAPLTVVGVAWLAAWHGARSADQGGQNVSGSNVERQDRLGATRLVFSGGQSSSFDKLRLPPIENVAPRWSAPWRDAAAGRELAPFDWTTVEGAGWPFRALASSFHVYVKPDITVGVTTHHGILIDPLPTGLAPGAPYELRALPTRPLWAGLALNWLLYAFALFGLMSMPTALKRGWRCRRGRCPDCGYDLRQQLEAGCPECGWRRAN